jgi:hypothetical protein
MKKEVQVYGLHLWEVSITGHSVKLLITTTTRNMPRAHAKARRFMQSRAKYRNSHITGAMWGGTLDA